MSALDSIFYIIVLILSVVMHEVAHGYAALYQGDKTAKLLGRLSPNPIRHLDPIGSVLVPLILIFSGTGVVFGWARPVPVDDRNFKSRKRGMVIVALAGIFANLVCALVFGFILRFAISSGSASIPFVSILTTIVIVNLVLALFNLMPIPPLDGSKVLFALLSERFSNIRNFLERYALFVIIFFIIFVWPYVAPALFSIFRLITGISF